MRRGLSNRQRLENRKLVAFYRDWMNNVRTRDLIKDLGELEEMARKRADWLTFYCKPHPQLPERLVELFQIMEQHERNLVEKFAFMGAKLGWVLDDMNKISDVLADPKIKPDTPPVATVREFKTGNGNSPGRSLVPEQKD
jgi:hypothetical protein